MQQYRMKDIGNECVAGVSPGDRYPVEWLEATLQEDTRCPSRPVNVDCSVHKLHTQGHEKDRLVITTVFIVLDIHHTACRQGSSEDEK